MYRSPGSSSGGFSFHESISASDGQREAATSEPLLRSRVLVDLSWLHLLLSLALHGLATLLLVVLSLHLLELASESLDFVLVLVNLSLVHVQLSGHGLHLVGLLLQVLLVDRELLSYFWAWLSGKEVLEFDVKLLFLLNGHVLLDYLLSFLDQALLESLNLEQELESVGVSSLQLPPSVVVQWVLKLLRKSFHLKALFLEGVTEAENLFLVLGDL